jgi:hypothetical protein
MATLALSLGGQFVGGAVGGPIGATIGRALGALAGSAVDNALFGERAQPAVGAGADIRLTGSSEGGAVPRLYGWSRLGGNIIWATELEEIAGESAGAKGFGATEEGERSIVGSFAVAFCEGQVRRLGRIWADGQLLDTEGVTLRFYVGSETQEADSLIEAVQGADNAPAYRGVCYVVFERLPLAPFGNRIPNIAVELCRVVGDLESQIRAVNLIPGAGEFVYDPVPRMRLVSPGVTASENTHVSANVSDWTVSVDELVALCPNLETVQLVIAWFGDDLRCAHCTVAPRTEGVSRSVSGTSWSVAGLTRTEAQVSSMHEGGLAYGGTPSDASVLAAIADLKARGLKVTLYPLMMMDIPTDNPMGQPAYPWRGRISCDPAPGAVGSPDGTATAAAQVAAFVPGYRDFVLHYADLSLAAGGVDALIIGTEMKALNAVRGEDDSFPFVEALVELADDVRAVVGPDCKLTYAADWSEVTGYQPGAGAKFFHLDPLWASDAIDAVGIDNYMPIADWRDGTDHADAADWDSIYDLDYLRAGIGGGDGYDWYYADEAARLGGVRSSIDADAYGEPWVWRFKDLESWWLNVHHDRPGGVRNGTPTDWVPGSKQIWFTEIGCGAVDKGANQPSAFADPKSIENTRPFFSSGTPDALMQRQYLRAQFAHWASDANPTNGGGMKMVDVARMAPWAWDARPYPAFPSQREAWSDWPNYATGHWLNGRLGGLASDELVAAIAADYGVEVGDADAAGPLTTGLTVEAVTTARDAMAPVLAIAGLGVRDAPEGLSFGRVSARAPLPVDDVVAAGDGALATRTRPDASEAVGQVAFGYLDRERGIPRRFRHGDDAHGCGATSAERTALVLDGQGARQAVERLLIDQAAQRDTLEFALPHSAAALEVGDAVSACRAGRGAVRSHRHPRWRGAADFGAGHPACARGGDCRGCAARLRRVRHRCGRCRWLSPRICLPNRDRPLRDCSLRHRHRPGRAGSSSTTRRQVRALAGSTGAPRSGNCSSHCCRDGCPCGTWRTRRRWCCARGTSPRRTTPQCLPAATGSRSRRMWDGRSLVTPAPN